MGSMARSPSALEDLVPEVGLGLPGQDFITRGLDDLRRGRETIESLLVSIGAPRLRDIGLPVPEVTCDEPELRLYRRLSRSDSDSAHSRYNALIRRLVSYERAAECAKSRIREESSD